MSKNRKTSLDSLLNETLESFYWIGFIMADGHLSKNNRLKLILSDKDKEHLEKFSKFIDFKGKYLKRKIGKYRATGIQVMHTKVAKKLREIFGFDNRKTYNPCEIKFLGFSDKMFSLLIGFIDGDGCILNQSGGRRDCSLRLKCHVSWENNLNIFTNLINSYKWDDIPILNPKINKQGYVELCISNNFILGKMKTKAVKLKLPIMERKWSKIDSNFKGKRQKAKENVENVTILVNKGMRNGQISNTLKISPSTVTAIMKRAGLKFMHKQQTGDQGV
jgi:hypothetical protein